MSEWNRVRLGEVAEISTGFSFKGEEYEFEGELRVVRGENVTVGNLRWDSQKYWNRNVKGLEQYILGAGDIVIGMDGSRVGHNRAKIKQNELPLILAQRVARIKAKRNFDQTYLWYCIYSNAFKDYVEAIHTGTSIPHISQGQIADFDLLIPDSLAEQKSIASILSSLDDKIDLLHRQNATLEKMAETLFRQWFVEEAREESEYQLILGDLIESVSITHKFPYPDIVFLNTSDIYLGNVIEHGLSKTESLPGQAKKSIQKEDILFSEIRPENGRWAYIDFEAANYVVSTKLMVLRSKKVLSQAFIYFYLTNPSTVEWLQLIAESRSGTFPQITFDQIKVLKINVPSEKILEGAIQWCETTLKKIKFNQTQIRTLTQLRDTLLPKLMNGEVRVN